MGSASTANLPIALNQPFRAREFTESAWTASMELVGADADLGAQAELAAVIEPRARVDDRPPRYRPPLTNRRAAEAGSRVTIASVCPEPCRAMCASAASRRVDHAGRRAIRSRYSVSPVRGLTARASSLGTTCAATPRVAAELDLVLGLHERPGDDAAERTPATASRWTKSCLEPRCRCPAGVVPSRIDDDPRPPSRGRRVASR